MPWDPEIYNKFKSERSAPFDDLLALVGIKPAMDVIDLGCGTGELTGKLAEHLPGSKVLGIDSSAEMLKDARRLENERLKFECRSIEEQLGMDRKWDLVFSNAAIQWVEDHQELLPDIISRIRPGGQLLIQVPAQQHNLTNKLLHDLSNQAPFITEFHHLKRASPVLDIDSYAGILFENGTRSMTVYEKIYPLVLKDSDALFDWVSGTALIPYMEKLSQTLQEDFIQAFKRSLQVHFEKTPVFYPFKRIIISGNF
jgi:trans-aconitate 2-methyltransferase